mgnify:CR=1 FL=1
MILFRGTMKTKNKILKSVFFLLILFGLGVAGSAYAVGEVTFFLRYQGNPFHQATLGLPAAGTISLTDVNGVVQQVNSRSVLAVLSKIDETSNAFAISKLVYFNDFSAFYLQCMKIGGVEACDNWQYVVDATYPSIGMDSYVLSGGEQVHIYFGTPHQVVLSANAITAGGSFTAKAQEYRYQDDTWGFLTGVTIDVFQGNSWDPTVIATKVVDANGEAVFAVSNPGTYSIAVKEDFYSPAVLLTVNPPSYSFGGPTQQTPEDFDVEKAVQFLAFNQNEDGSFGTGAMLIDWAALTLAAYVKETPVREKLKEYLLTSPDSGMLLTDYERRAMALMALGISPYGGTKTNYIAKIVDEFDGTQFGNPDLINDDIFALLPLLKAGYIVQDKEIASSVSFILSWQRPDGSWGGVDMTAAAVQALSLVPSFPNVLDALEKARQYLKNQQEPSESFGNVYSTSWAMQALEIKESSYLASRQAEDGGLEAGDILANRIWATSYAIPAALGKSWGSVLTQFEKPLLSQIEKEVIRISQEIAVLRTQVLAFVTLRHIEQELDRIALETKAVQIGIVQFKIQQIAQSFDAAQDKLVEQAPSQDLSGITLVQEDKTTPLTAEAREAVGAQGLSPQLIILLVVIGGAVFAFSGGMNSVLPLLRKALSRV